MKRCKLISPTNLMLEHPILSPVEECEYYLVGVKEAKRVHLRWFCDGVLVGMLAGVAIALFMEFLKAWG